MIIDMKQLLRYCLSCCISVEVVDFFLFQALDSNNDGFISKAEFAKLLKNMPMEKVIFTAFKKKNNYSVQVSVVMEKFDNDSDGLLDMDEFKSLMNKNQKKKEV